MNDRTCGGCGAPIEPGPRERNKRKWCSEACRVWRHHHPDGEMRPRAGRPCMQCGAPMDRAANALYCSERCAVQARPQQDRRRPRPPTFCANCGADITHRRLGAKTCSKACQVRRLHQAAGGRTTAALEADQRRRAAKKGSTVGRFSNREIYERDGWCCQLCHRKVRPELAYPHPLSKSIDHIVPLAEGGSHTPENVQLAHLRCNVQKGARPVGEQLRLIG